MLVPVPEISTPDTPPTPTQPSSQAQASVCGVSEVEEARRTTPRPEEAARSDENLQASIEEIWYLKEISFRPVPEAAPRMYKIVTQNYNGSVSSSFILSTYLRALNNRI